MEKQLLLPLDAHGRERLGRVWNQLPEQDRVALVALYAEVIAQASRASAPPQAPESDHESHG